MIIGFVGLPASGKTSAISLLENKGMVKRVTFKNKTDILFWFTLGYLRHPITFFKGLILVLKYRFEKYVIWNYFVVRYAYLGKASYSLNKCTVIDEPPLQNLYSLMVKNYNEEQLSHIYKSLPKPGYTIYFSIPNDERLRRKEKRARDLPNEFDKAWEKRLQKADAFLKEKLFNHPRSFCFNGEMSSLEKFLISIKE